LFRIAETDDLVDRALPQVGQRGIQRDAIAMDVGNDRNAHVTNDPDMDKNQIAKSLALLLLGRQRGRIFHSGPNPFGERRFGLEAGCLDQDPTFHGPTG
jgi:hypothetical protein